MYLVADSGSTKTDWAVVDGDKKVGYYKTKGLNPYFHDKETIVAELRAQPRLKKIANAVTRIDFYGSGASSPELQEKMKFSLSAFFKNARIEVDHDLKAAALSTYRGVPEISCILGTGSNACYFDGKELHQAVPSLGYVLGDEGSGSYFGRKLLQDYFYKRMPEEIANEFEKAFDLEKDKVIYQLYREPNPNVYLASHSLFLERIEKSDYANDLLFEGLSRFIEIHVLPIQESAEVEINFVGSIASHYQSILAEVCAEHDLLFGHVVKSPIEGLVERLKKLSN